MGRCIADEDDDAPRLAFPFLLKGDSESFGHGFRPVAATPGPNDFDEIYRAIDVMAQGYRAGGVVLSGTGVAVGDNPHPGIGDEGV